MKSRLAWVLAAMGLMGAALARADGPATAPALCRGQMRHRNNSGIEPKLWTRPAAPFEWSTYDEAKKTLDQHPDLIRYVSQYKATMGEMEGGETLLQSVASQGDAAKIQLLLSRGADINQQTKWYPSPLHLAIVGKADAVLLLIQKGADVNLAGPKGPALSPGSVAAG